MTTPPDPMTPIYVAEYADGDSLATIARRHHLGEVRLRNLIAAQGVTIRPPVRMIQAHPTGRHITAMIAAGQTYADISRAYGVNVDALHKRAARWREAQDAAPTPPEPTWAANATTTDERRAVVVIRNHNDPHHTHVIAQALGLIVQTGAEQASA